MKLIKVLHINSSMYAGGVESMICGLANEFGKSIDVTVCTIYKPKENDIFYNKLSGSIKKISIGKERLGFSVITPIKILKTIIVGSYDIVHIHNTFHYYALSILFLFKFKKFVYTIHTDAYMENSNKWDKVFFPLKKFCFRNNLVYPVTISKASQKSFEKLYNCKSTLILNGIPLPNLYEVKTLDKFRITNKTKVFFHPGRISTPKNQLSLCKVFKKLIYKGYDVSLIIAGYIQDENIFEDLSKYFSDRINYIGEQSEIPSLLAKSDAMCLISIWEGLPITLLESISVGCIPICSPVGGIVDVIRPDYNGILANSYDVDDYYDAIIKFLEMSPESISTMRKNCIESFEPFNISSTSNKYLELYQK